MYFPTENGDNSGGCGGLAGNISSDNWVVSRTEQMMSRVNSKVSDLMDNGVARCGFEA